MKKDNPQSQIVPNNSFTEFLLYTTPNGKVKVEIFLRDENIWLTHKRGFYQNLRYVADVLLH